MGAYIFYKVVFRVKKGWVRFVTTNTQKEKKKKQKRVPLLVLDRFIANARIFILSPPA